MTIKPDSLVIATTSKKAHVVITIAGYEYPFITTTVHYVETMSLKAIAHYFDHHLMKHGIKQSEALRRLKIIARVSNIGELFDGHDELNEYTHEANEKHMEGALNKIYGISTGEIAMEDLIYDE